MAKNNLLIVLIFIGLLAALVPFLHRYSTEAHNRRVELVIDWTDAQALANTTSRAIDDVLTQLRESGITTVAVTEDTLDTLRANGIVTYRRDGDTTVLRFAPGFPGQKERVLQMLQHKSRLIVMPKGTSSLRVNAPWPQFNGLPIGLDSDAVAIIQRNQLLVAPRLLNFTGVTPENIAWVLGQTKAQCATPEGEIGPFIFSGAAVLGNRPLIDVTAQALADNHLTYGSVEFAKTFGDDVLARKAAAQTVRVHSIGNDEMGAMDEPTAVERFVRAARERNIRVCYVRLFTNGLIDDPDLIHANTEFVIKVDKGLTEAHLSLGQAHPYNSDPKPGFPLRAVMAIGVVAGGMLLLRIFTAIDGRAFWVTLMIGLLAGIALAHSDATAKGREALALLAACTFPTLGLCYYAVPLCAPPDGPSGDTRGQALRRAFAAYARMTLATLAGIVFVVGLLTGRLFLLKVDEFLGVKMVLVAPVLLVAAYYGLGLAALGPRADWAARRARMKETLHAVSSQPLLIGQVVIGLVALVALALFVARSGNDPGVGVSPAELKMRAVLDKYLLVRPRTKEFLLGHPALFFGLAAAFSGRFTGWVLPLLIIGSIGQSSLMDTFCHLHTPLFISLLRGVIGWLLGAVFGALLFVAAARPVSQPEPVAAGAGA